MSEIDITGLPNADDGHMASVNKWLRKLKWPHVTEGQSRTVLMGRGDNHE